MPAFQKVARLLVRHLDGILAYRHEAYCYEKVPFGMVEAINGNIRALLRRGRGYRDHEYLRLKVQKATAERRRLLRTAMNAGHVTDSREDGVFTPASNGEVKPPPDPAEVVGRFVSILIPEGAMRGQNRVPPGRRGAEPKDAPSSLAGVPPR